MTRILNISRAAHRRSVGLALAVLVTPIGGAQQSSDDATWPVGPTPRRITWRRQTVSAARVACFVVLDPDPAWAGVGTGLGHALAERGAELTTGAGADPDIVTVMLARDPNPPFASPEAYRLDISYRRITVAAPTAAGLQRGVNTLLRIADAGASIHTLPKCTIVDWPWQARRGVVVGSVDDGPALLVSRITALAPLQINAVALRAELSRAVWPAPHPAWVTPLCVGAAATHLQMQWIVVGPGASLASHEWFEPAGAWDDHMTELQRFAAHTWQGPVRADEVSSSPP